MWPCCRNSLKTRGGKLFKSSNQTNYIPSRIFYHIREKKIINLPIFFLSAMWMIVLLYFLCHKPTIYFMKVHCCVCTL